MLLRSIKNEKGMATLLVVAMFAVILITTFTTAHVYLNHRAREHSQIRQAYRYTFVLEDLSKLVHNAVESCYLAGCNVNPPASYLSCPPGSVGAPLPQEIGPPPIHGCWPQAGGGGPSFCVPNSLDPNTPFCVSRNEYEDSSLKFLKWLIAELSPISVAYAEKGGPYPYPGGGNPPGPGPGPGPSPTPQPGEYSITTPVCNNQVGDPPLCQTCLAGDKNCQKLKSCVIVGGGGKTGRTVCFDQPVRLNKKITQGL